MASYDNHGNGMPGDDNEAARKVIQTLHQLPKVKAAPDFDLRLQRRINIEQVTGKEASLLERVRQGWRVPAFAVSVLALVCVGITAYYSLMKQGISPTAPSQQQPMMRGVSDSTEKESNTQPGTSAPIVTGVKSPTLPGSNDAAAAPPPAGKKTELEVQKARPTEIEEMKETIRLDSRQDRATSVPQVEQQAGKGVLPETFKVQAKDRKTLQSTYGVSLVVDTSAADSAKRRQDSLKALQKAKQLLKQKEK
jgi:hypothetical protein